MPQRGIRPTLSRALVPNPHLHLTLTPRTSWPPERLRARTWQALVSFLCLIETRRTGLPAMPALIRPVDELGFPIPAKFDDPPAGAGEPRRTGHQSFNDSAAGGGSSSSSSPCCSSAGRLLISGEAWSRTFRSIGPSATWTDAICIGRSITLTRRSLGSPTQSEGRRGLFNGEPNCTPNSTSSTAQ